MLDQFPEVCYLCSAAGISSLFETIVFVYDKKTHNEETVTKLIAH